MKIKVSTTEKAKSDALQVRHLVFVQEQKVPENIEIDEFEQTSIHFIGYKNDQAIAAGRLRWIEHYGKLERLCVLKEYRHQSYGLQMLQRMEEETIKNNYNHTLLHAQVSVIPFYKRIGYEVVSDEFMDAGIPHVTMTKQLK